MSLARDLADLGSSATKLDAVGSNLIINGAMQVAQRGTSATTLSGSEIFRADRFRVEQGSVTANNGTTEVSTDVPSGQGFTKSLKVTGGSSVSYGANGYTAINYRGEGQDFSQISHGTSSAKTVTISFWVKSSVTGTYSLNHTKYDGSTERFNVSEYTISQANTWEYKKISVTGDTSVSASDWIRLYWHLGGDSGHKGATAGSWVNGAATVRATSNQPDMISTNGATFFITGVQMEVGDTATDFEHRSFGDELARCQRYFEKFGGNAAYERLTVGFIRSGGSSTRTPLFFKVQKRAAPTSTSSGSIQIEDGSGTQIASAVAFGDQTINSAAMNLTVSGRTAGHGVMVVPAGTTSFFINVDAEL